MPRRPAVFLTPPRNIPDSSLACPACPEPRRELRRVHSPVYTVCVQKRSPSPFLSTTSPLVHKNTRVSGFVLANPEWKNVSPKAFFNFLQFRPLHGSRNTPHRPRTHNPFRRNTYKKQGEGGAAYLIFNNTTPSATPVLPSSSILESPVPASYSAPHFLATHLSPGIQCPRFRRRLSIVGGCDG